MSLSLTQALSSSPSPTASVPVFLQADAAMAEKPISGTEGFSASAIGLATATLLTFPTSVLAASPSPIPASSDPVTWCALGAVAAGTWLAGAVAGSTLKHGWRVMRGQEKIQSAAKAVVKSTWMPTLALAAGAALTVMTAGSFWHERVVPHGEAIATEALENMDRKLAVEVMAGGLADAEQALPVGWVYGANLGDGAVSENLRGVDRSIWVNPDEMKSGGKLHTWYEALKFLEDQQHEGGLSDHTGISARMLLAPVRAAEARWHGEKMEGASSIADQACGAMQDHLIDEREILSSYSGSLLDELPEKWRGALAHKLHGTFCGVGLSQLREPREIAAYYATFGFVADGAEGVELFVRQYWVLDGIQDPQLSRGQQIVLAAMLRHPWQGKNRDETWRQIERRALVALDGLVEDGIIAANLREQIRREIIMSRPPEKILPGRVRFDALYDYPVKLAVREAQEKYGPEWRRKVAAIELSIDPQMQRGVHEQSEAVLRDLPDPTGVSVLAGIQDDQGFLRAIETGILVKASSANADSSGSGGQGHSQQEVWQWKTDDVDRYYGSNLSVGSLGKILLTLGASQYLTLDDIHAPAPDPAGPVEDISAYFLSDAQLFLQDLRSSSGYIVDDSHSIGVPPALVRGLINCYGKFHDGDEFPALDAARGVFDTTASQFSGILGHVATGHFYQRPHVVRAFVMRDGTREEVLSHPVDFPPSPHCDPAAVAGSKTFADFVHNPVALSLLAEPLSGTLHIMRGTAHLGKTGTVGRMDRSTNNRAWILAGWYDGVGGATFHREETRPFYTVLLTVGHDRDWSAAVAGLGTAGETLAPVASNMAHQARERLKATPPSP